MLNKMTSQWILVVLWMGLFIRPAGADGTLPREMNYQGYLTDSGGAAIDGTRTFIFRLYETNSGGSAVWTETQSSVAVSNGIFNVVLGEVNPINLPFREKYYLSMQVQGEASEMSPRHALSSAAYSLASNQVVHQQVLTVAQSGGDTCTVYGALQLLALEPTPGSATPWVIHVEAGYYDEPGAWVIPGYVTIQGVGKTASRCQVPGISFSGDQGCLDNLFLTIQNVTTGIDLQSHGSISIQNCWIIGTTFTTLIDMSSTGYSELIDNHIVTSDMGSYTMVNADGSGYLFLQGNLIEFRMAQSTETGIDAQNLSAGVVRNNTIRFNYLSYSADCHAILVNNNSYSGRIDYNALMGSSGTPARDIYCTITSAYPNRSSGYSGPFGIGNHGTTGSELAAF